MPTRTRPVAVWTPAFVADTVAATLGHANERGLLRAVGDVARAHGLLLATVEEWVARARAVQAAPVPPGLLFCHACDQPMILVQLPGCAQLYLCAPTCGRAPVPAEAVRDAVAAAMMRRKPHLVPAGRTSDAAAYAPGAMLRVSIGATSTDLHITWRTAPRQLTGPLMSMAQRLHHARQYSEGHRSRAIEVLRTGLIFTDPAGHKLALDTATAQATALLAELTLTNGDPQGALPWAAWAHRSLRRLLGATSPQARTALKLLATAHRRADNHKEAATCYSDLIRYNSEAEGPDALPTLAAQATLALVLYDAGRCGPARRLLARTITTHRHAHPQHSGGTRMVAALDRMRATCIDKHHGHQAGFDE
ncbi:tetratricopeptide repeat protein [Micromonospora sp. NPDC048830]|uniref:tetratricopeptide repeat protein n=1 Tax=Micromonospora sp. NPDC048830 TaxID=3364257 RepID=UPI0037210C1C